LVFNTKEGAAKRPARRQPLPGMKTLPGREEHGEGVSVEKSPKKGGGLVKAVRFRGKGKGGKKGFSQLGKRGKAKAFAPPRQGKGKGGTDGP